MYKQGGHIQVSADSNVYFKGTFTYAKRKKFELENKRKADTFT